jgi:hypothetical protein
MVEPIEILVVIRTELRLELEPPVSADKDESDGREDKIVLAVATPVVAGSATVVAASIQQLDSVGPARRVVETVGTGPSVV